MSARPKKAVMGRPKTIIGKLVTCPFVLTHKQSAWVTRRAKACKVSRSEIMRALVQVGMAGDAVNADEHVMAPKAYAQITQNPDLLGEDTDP